MKRMIIFVLAIMVIQGVSGAEQVTKNYIFIPSQSTLRQTGGYAGIDELFTIEGYFDVTVDFDANAAQFDYVDAIATDDSNYGPHDINEVFQMTQLVSTEVNEFSISFEDTNPSMGGIEINLLMTFQGGQVHLTGTRQWPSVPDSFQYDIDAVAQDTGVNCIYVDDDANGLNNGSSWADAYNHLQDALTIAGYCNKPVEVHVAQGVYEPDSNSIYPDGTGDREVSFNLINGVTVKGGYAGFGEPEPGARDFEMYETILSGDLDGNDVELSDPCDLSDEPTRAENSIHVVSTVGTDNSAVLDGFIVTGGNANGESLPRYWGGGVYNENLPDVDFGCTEQGPTIINCKIIRNFAAGEGGGMYNRYSCKPQLIDCEFALNVSRWGGGAIKNDTSHPDIVNCTFRNNIIASLSELYPSGGAIDNEESSPLCTSCLFIANEANYGGAVGNWICDCDPVFVNCNFYGNTAQHGGVLWVSNDYGTSHIQFINSTLAGNFANNGSAISCTQGYFKQQLPSYVDVNNCIFWNSGDEINNEDGSSISITYSDIEGCGGSGAGWDTTIGIDGGGNIDVDPLFADPCNGDYRLQSQAGRWDANSQSWVTDTNTSECIDAGDPNSDWTAELWPHGERINMGAYGGTPQASMSLSDLGNIADLDDDGDVDYNDLMLFTGKWPIEQVLLAEDLDRNGKVDFEDYVIFANEWFNEYIGEPGMTYEITKCGGGIFVGNLDQTRFTVTVEGNYIHFEDVMVANCCPTELWLEMYVNDDEIIIYEKEFAEFPCTCICDNPVDAVLGPFKPGTYTLEVYEDWGGFIGSMIVVIE